MVDRRWLLRLALVLAVFANNANFSATTVALPSIQHSLGLGFTGLQWTMTAYLLTYSAGMLPGGRLSDALGTRTVLLWGIGLYLGAMLIVASATDLPVLLAGRLLQGAAAALITPATTAAARTRFSGAAQTATIGLIVGMSAIGQALGPLFGGLLDQGAGWRAVFVVNIPLLAVAAVLTLTTMEPGHRRAGPARLDVTGAALFAAALALLTIALVESENYGLANPVVLAGLAAAAAVLVLFFARAGRPDALLDARLLRDRTFAASTAVGFTMTFTLASVLFFAALYLERVRGYGSVRTGLLFLPMTALFGVLSTQAARVERRFGRRLPALGGLAVACAGSAVLALDTPSAPIAAPLAGLFLIGLGLGVSWAQVTGAGLRAAPPGQAGQAAGILFTARWVGGTLGIAVLGLVYRRAADARLAALLGGPGHALGPRAKDQLDGLLSGSAPARAVLSGLPAPLRAAAVAAVRDAAARGSAWALAGVAVVAGAGAALCLLMPRERAAVRKAGRTSLAQPAGR